MAKAAAITICEVEEIVPRGAIPPDHVHLQGIYVDRIVLGSNYEKRIEKLALSDESGKLVTVNQTKKGQQKLAVSAVDAASAAAAKREAHRRRMLIVKRAAKEFRDGMFVNLGIGYVVCNFLSYHMLIIHLIFNTIFYQYANASIKFRGSAYPHSTAVGERYSRPGTVPASRPGRSRSD